MADEPWAQLVSNTDASDPVKIAKTRFSIGRASGNDLHLADNLLVSGCHCYIQKDETDGTVWLHDTSTNGTLLNLTNKLSHQSVRLKHGDEITIVSQKNDPRKNVAYIFQDLEELKHIEQLESSGESNSTLPYECSLEDTLEVDKSSGECDDVPQPSAKRQKCEPSGKTSSVSQSADNGGAPTQSSNLSNRHSMETDKKTITSRTNHESQDSLTHTARALSDTTGVVDAKLAALPCSGTSTSGLEESLMCTICQEILHNCISIQPCMHSFCAGCYSEWMERSSSCPSCRAKVERVSKNHLVNNLVEAFLKSNPDKKRSDDDLRKLDAKNKIMQDMSYPKRPRTAEEEWSDSDDASLSDDDDDDSDDSDDVAFGHPYPGYFQPPGINFGMVRPVKTVCRQCPEYNDQMPHNTSSSATAPAGGSTSTAADVPHPAYVCNPAQNHIMCLCCMQPMPDRRRDHVIGVVIPPQSCVVCQRVYCHMYWGCKRVGCNGCLSQFKAFPFGREVLSRLILDNEYESEIFQKYLDAQHLSAADLLAECCKRLADGSYTCTDQHFLASGEAAICLACFRRNFAELAYQYRQDIPRDDILAAAAVADRPDCYWGRNCRTQKNKLAHAQKFNHICEQTRAS